MSDEKKRLREENEQLKEQNLKLCSDKIIEKHGDLIKKLDDD